VVIKGLWLGELRRTQLSWNFFSLTGVEPEAVWLSKKITPGITALSSRRGHIGGKVCDLDVECGYP